MNQQHRSRWPRRIIIALSVVIAPLVLIAAVVVAMQSQAQASSHREAPLISKDAFADNTDTYVFISPENQNNVVFVASWIPFEGPEGGPNYWEWDDTALYDIYVDNDGDAKPDITYTLSSKVSVGNPTTFLYNTAPIVNPGDSAWNRKQYITVTESLDTGTMNLLVGNKLAAPVNIGEKSTDNYAELEKTAIFGASAGLPPGVKVFAGQSDDPFFVDLQVFDLLTLRGQEGLIPPKPGGLAIGYVDHNTPVDSVSGFNVHTLVVEVPISRVKSGSEPVLGVWSSTRRPTTTVLAADGSATNAAYKQISRLGMPLVNEVVLPLALKDAFNGLKADQDAVLYTGGAGAPIQKLLQKSVEDPEIGNLLCGLYGVPMPADANKDCMTELQYISDVGAGGLRSGRGDIFDIFLRGMVLAKPFDIQTKNGKVTLNAGSNVNRPANVTPAEMIRINTDIKGDTCSPTPSRLGVLGGDACGFPNGRRLTDDVVEIELLAVAGAAYQVLDGRDASFAFNPALINVLTDSINENDLPFRSSFPYVAMAQSGQAHWHVNAFFNFFLPFIEEMQSFFDWSESDAVTEL